MRKLALLTVCFALVLSPMLIGGNGKIQRDTKETYYEWARDGSEMEVDVSGSLGGFATEFSTALFGFSGSEPSGNPRGTDCVEVDIELPDSVGPGPGGGWGPPAEGHFELLNCGDAPAEIHLTFALTIIVDHIADTTVISPDFTVYLGAGESISHDFLIPVPPFDGVYTACVTAVAGEAEATDCATMVVNGIEFPGVPFSAPGILVQGTNCVLFAPHGNPEVAFELENYGSFQVGDEVFVSGTLFWDCDTDCVDADGCVLDNTIEDFEIPDIPFEACGVLIQGTDCVLLSVYSDSLLLALDNYGDFVVGDSVCVVGMLDPDCETDCSDATACLIDNDIFPYTEEPPVDFSACGTLIPAGNCIAFQPFGGPMGPIWLENVGPYVLYDTVFVVGQIAPGCDNPCDSVQACLLNNTIEPCFPPEPGVPFEACGVLSEGTGCTLFTPLITDTLATESFTLEFYNGFGPGDTVFVAGLLQIPCEGTCPEAIGCIDSNFIDVCTEPDPGFPFEACGVLTQGVECLLLETLEPYPYGLFVVENLGQYTVGDTVFVAGTLLQDCPSICMEGTGCIVGNMIEPCPGDPGDGIPVQGCGVLVPDSGCVLFVPTVTIPGLPGGGVLLENYGTFGIWDTVFVDGMFEPGFQPGCPSALGIVEENTIGVCDSVFLGLPNGLEVQNYPNPFNPATTIALTLPYDAEVKVTIYNIMGQVVTTLVDDVLGAGKHEFVWNSSNAGVASGMYFYRVQAGDIDVTKKMLLVK